MTTIEIRSHEAFVMDWDGKTFTVTFDGRGSMDKDEDRLATSAHKAARTKRVRNGKPLTTFRLIDIDGKKVKRDNEYS